MIATHVLEATAALVSALVWPVALLCVVLVFRTQLRDLLTNASTLTIKASGVEASFTRGDVQAAASLGAASAAHGESLDPTAVFDTIDALRRAAQKSRGTTRILWVDDDPANNEYERQVLESLDITVVLATSTAEALVLLNRVSFDLVISDMGRPDDNRAGYTLVDTMRQGGDLTPFIIYAGSKTEEYTRAARAHGAVGTTNLPSELIGMVMETLDDSSAR